MIEALSKNWKYDRKHLEDAYDVCGEFDGAEEIIEFMNSEKCECVIDALELMFEFHAMATFSSVFGEDDLDAGVISRLREEREQGLEAYNK